MIISCYTSPHAVSIPVSGAFEPVKDVGAAGVVDLVKWMSVRLLHSHCVAGGKENTTTDEQDVYKQLIRPHAQFNS